MKRGTSFFATVGSMAFVVAMLILLIQMGMASTSFYSKQFQLTETSRRTGIGYSSLMQTTEELNDYLKGKTDELPAGNILSSKQAKSMQEIKKTYSVLSWVKYIGFLLAIGFYALVFAKDSKQWADALTEGYARGLGIVFFVLVIVGLLISIDQITLQITTQYLPIINAIGSFSGGDSLFESIYPSSLWFALLIHILWRVIFILGGLLVICIGYFAYRSYRKRTFLELKEEE